MKNQLLIVIAFAAGLGGGWFGRIFLESNQIDFGTFGTSEHSSTDIGNVAPSSNSSETTRSEIAQASQSATEINISQSNIPEVQTSGLVEDNSRTSIIAEFEKLLSERRYFEAMTLFQEQKQQSEQNASDLKIILLEELRLLTQARSNSDFSEFVEAYLSIYYDDIDVLLLLADFNHANGSYHEVVNVFLLAKTYSYSIGDQEKVANRFSRFVGEVDRFYTGQKDWWSLISLYAHIDASGLTTSSFQYRQALAHLRSGDESFAIEQFNQLLDDSVVGESAAKILSNLNNEVDVQAPTIVYNSLWEGADTIALEKIGNQYAVDLDSNRQTSVKLLIDTGASMTAMSTESFNKINASGDATVEDRRVFRTANGLVQATVYSVPELTLGPHRLENTQIAVIDISSERGFSGLLGMNILGQFRFQIDQDNVQLLLSKK